MKINVTLDDPDDQIEFEQSDIEDMWNYLFDDTEDFIYGACNRLQRLDLDYHQDNNELYHLYLALKDIYEPI